MGNTFRTFEWMFRRIFDNFNFSWWVIFDIIKIIIFLGFAALAGYVIYKDIKKQKFNNPAPMLTVRAKVVYKRNNATAYSNNPTAEMNCNPNTNVFTKFYISFEFESKDRLEFIVPENEYLTINEGDFGNLTLKGNQFIKFEK